MNASEFQYPIIETVAELMALEWIEIDPHKSHKMSGIYLVKDRITGEVLYAGRSVRIGDRLLHGEHPVYKSDSHAVFVYRVSGKKLLWYLEAVAIYLLKPKYNYRQGFLEKPAVTQMVDRWWNNQMMK